jgi:hypothetical protein
VGNAGLTIFKVCHVGKTPNGQNIIHVDGRDKLVVRREEYTDIFSRDMGLEEMI